MLVLAFVFAVGTREGCGFGRSLFALCSHFFIKFIISDQLTNQEGIHENEYLRTHFVFMTYKVR